MSFFFKPDLHIIKLLELSKYFYAMKYYLQLLHIFLYSGIFADTDFIKPEILSKHMKQ